MKNLVILLIILLTSCSHKLTVKDKTFISVQLSITPEQVMSCNEQEANFFISKRQILLNTNNLNLDLKVVDRKIGKYYSWLVKSKTNDYYFVTAGESQGYNMLMLQPVEPDLTRRNDLPIIVLTNAPICK